MSLPGGGGTHFSGSCSKLSISSLVMPCSAPSIGILLAKDPVAIRIFLACTPHQALDLKGLLRSDLLVHKCKGYTYYVLFSMLVHRD